MAMTDIEDRGALAVLRRFNLYNVEKVENFPLDMPRQCTVRPVGGARAHRRERHVSQKRAGGSLVTGSSEAPEEEG